MIRRSDVNAPGEERLPIGWGVDGQSADIREKPRETTLLVGGQMLDDEDGCAEVGRELAEDGAQSFQAARRSPNDDDVVSGHVVLRAFSAIDGMTPPSAGTRPLPDGRHE
jgi:hypothetical protein